MFEFITISPYNVHSLNIILGIFLHNYPCIMFLTGNGEELLSCLAKCRDEIFSFNQPTQMLPLLSSIFFQRQRCHQQNEAKLNNKSRLLKLTGYACGMQKEKVSSVPHNCCSLFSWIEYPSHIIFSNVDINIVIHC